MGWGREIIEVVSQWSGIAAHSHRFGGTEFRVGKVEIGHIHGDYLLDVPFTRAIRAALVADADAQPHHILPESGWISFYLRRPEDVVHGVKLLRLSYLHKQLRRATPEVQSAYVQELAALGLGPHIESVLAIGQNGDQT